MLALRPWSAEKFVFDVHAWRWSRFNARKANLIIVSRQIRRRGIERRKNGPFTPKSRLNWALDSGSEKRNWKQDSLSCVVTKPLPRSAKSSRTERLHLRGLCRKIIFGSIIKRTSLFFCLHTLSVPPWKVAIISTFRERRWKCMRRGALAQSTPNPEFRWISGSENFNFDLVTKLFYYFLFLRRPFAVPGRNFKSNERTLSHSSTNPDKSDRNWSSLAFKRLKLCSKWKCRAELGKIAHTSIRLSSS